MSRKKHGIKFTGPKKAMMSICLSLFLVAVSVGIVFGMKYYLADKEYTGPILESGLEDVDTKQEYLDVDGGFRPRYVMICDTKEKKVWADSIPGEKDESSVALSEGQIVLAKARGTWQGKTYYQLPDNRYISANITHAQPLVSYTKVEGYVAVTYISSSGVKLRSWADFDADNVVKSVFVGDKVPVEAKVETEKGDVAYITTEGLYITADTRYLNDYTSVPEGRKP